MVAHERHALFNAVVTSAALLLFVALLPFLGPVRAQGGFGLLGLTGFGILFFRKRAAQVLTDERDQLINLRALQVGVAVFWVLFAEGVAAMCVLRRGEGTVSVYVLSFIGFAGWAVFLLAHSVTMLVLYRRS